MPSLTDAILNKDAIQKIHDAAEKAKNAQIELELTVSKARAENPGFDTPLTTVYGWATDANYTTILDFTTLQLAIHNNPEQYKNLFGKDKKDN